MINCCHAWEKFIVDSLKTKSPFLKCLNQVAQMDSFLHIHVSWRVCTVVQRKRKFMTEFSCFALFFFLVLG
uniref:Uncharacterized protein n=1 Tax=Rhizophora mucronata TaxID=61149 RepID=A0A2P2IQ41_RHIMU